MINDIILNSNENIANLEIKSLKDIQISQNFIISMSKVMQSECKQISNFLYDNVYNHPKLIKKRANSENIIFKLFEYFNKFFEKLPSDWLLKSEFELRERIICDYISGMTDRYASKLYKSVYE